jgi:hypothetical protein
MQGHLIPLMKGCREPKPPKVPRAPEGTINNQKKEDQLKYRAAMQVYNKETLPEYKRCCTLGKEWTLTKAAQVLVDMRPAGLTGCPAAWMSASWRPMTNTGLSLLVLAACWLVVHPGCLV